MRLWIILALALFSLNTHADGRITNADINSAAAIQYSKLASIADQTILGNISGGAAAAVPLSVAQAAGLLGVAADAFGLDFTPTTGGDWTTAPINVGDALDELAARDVTAGNLTETSSAVLSITGGTGAVLGAGTTIQVQQATTLASGYLSASDWNAFSGKQPGDADLTALAALAGTNTIYYRSAANTWSAVTIGSGLSFAGGTLAATGSGESTTVSDTDSINLTLTGSDITADLDLSAASADAGHINAVNSIESDGLQVQVPIADTSTTGVLTDTDWDTFSGKQAAGNYITALTADGTASGPGSAALTLATVNGNVGSFTYGSFTVNGKGLITAASSGAAPEVPLTFGSGVTRTVNAVTCDVASGSIPGCLSTADWTTFNGKQAAGNYITGLTGDVTASGPGSVAATIANDAVTNAKAANMAQSTIKGRAVGAGTGDPTDLTATQATEILNVMTGDAGSGGLKGLVPAQATGDATKCLLGDGTWGTCGGGSADAVTKDIAQATHGLSVCNAIRYNGTIYVKSQADADANSEVYGVVSAVADANNFTVTTEGHVSGCSGFTAGSTSYLSAATAGALTTTAPSATGEVFKPVLNADSTTSGFVIQRSGVVVGAPVVADQTGNSGEFLTTNGTVTSWSLVPLATGVSGTLPVANGGTGRTSLTNHGVLVGATTSGITQLSAAAAGTLLTGQGASADPSFSATPTLGIAGTTKGTLALAGNTSGTVTVQPAAAAGTWNLTLPNSDGDANQVLVTDGSGVTSWSTAADASAVTKSYAITAHGFAVNDVVYCTAATTCAKAIATANNDLADTMGIVTVVTDANNFTVTTYGYASTLTGLTANTVYWLSDVTAGLLTATQPTTVGHVSKLMLKTDATTSGKVFDVPGDVITAAVSGVGSSIYCTGGNGRGGSSSGETAVRNFTTCTTNGSDITRTARTTTSGDYFTINTTGNYVFSFTDARTGGGTSVGFTIDATGGTLDADPSTPITNANGGICGWNQSSAANVASTIGCTYRINAGTKLRAQGSTAANFTNDTVTFSITRLN